MTKRCGESGHSDRFYFLGLQITVNSDSSHEIKRHLILERKAMTNLDSILKSRETTLPTKFRIVKAMVFPVVVYTCESWTIKKAECLRLILSICGAGKTLESPLDFKQVKPVNSKGNHPKYPLERLMLKLLYFCHLMWRADPWGKTLILGYIEGKRRGGSR